MHGSLVLQRCRGLVGLQIASGGGHDATHGGRAHMGEIGVSFGEAGGPSSRLASDRLSHTGPGFPDRRRSQGFIVLWLRKFESNSALRGAASQLWCFKPKRRITHRPHYTDLMTYCLYRCDRLNHSLSCVSVTCVVMCVWRHVSRAITPCRLGPKLPITMGRSVAKGTGQPKNSLLSTPSANVASAPVTYYEPPGVTPAAAGNDSGVTEAQALGLECVVFLDAVPPPPPSALF